jgi:PilZ domain-containing protein
VKPEDPQAKRIRRHERHHLDRRVTVTSDQPGRGRIGGRCDTLGEGGFGARLAGELEIGENVTVELTHGPAGKRETITFRAVVRNKTGFHHGFEFLDVTTTLRRQVKALMEEDSDKQ